MAQIFQDFWFILNQFKRFFSFAFWDFLYGHKVGGGDFLSQVHFSETSLAKKLDFGEVVVESKLDEFGGEEVLPFTEVGPAVLYEREFLSINDLEPINFEVDKKHLKLHVSLKAEDRESIEVGEGNRIIVEKDFGLLFLEHEDAFEGASRGGFGVLLRGFLSGDGTGWELSLSVLVHNLKLDLVNNKQ